MVLGFAGGIGSGKDTACEIAEEFGFVKRGFSDYLKYVCSELTGHDYHLRKTKDSEVLPGVTGRKLLETIGQTMRNLYPDFWIDNIIFDKCCIPDTRYPNEVKAIRDQGGIVIKILRDGVQRTGHESDNWEDLDCDYVIENNGTLEEFKQKVRECIEHL